MTKLSSKRLFLELLQRGTPDLLLPGAVLAVSVHLGTSDTVLRSHQIRQHLNPKHTASLAFLTFLLPHKLLYQYRLQCVSFNVSVFQQTQQLS